MQIHYPEIPESHIGAVNEAKAKLSEILHLADDTPQYIGKRKPYVVLPMTVWEEINKPDESMGKWLVENLSGIGELELPNRKEEDNREIPFQ